MTTHISQAAPQPLSPKGPPTTFSPEPRLDSISPLPGLNGAAIREEPLGVSAVDCVGICPFLPCIELLIVSTFCSIVQSIHFLHCVLQMVFTILGMRKQLSQI